MRKQKIIPRAFRLLAMLFGGWLAIGWMSEKEGFIPFGWADTQKCMVEAVAINFGAYNASSSFPLDSQGYITVKCSSPTPVSVKLDPGQNSKRRFNPRKMRSKEDLLLYNLYVDAACTMVWGDGTSSTFTMRGTGNDQFVVYGRIPAEQNVEPGHYTDVVTVIVEW